MDLETGTEELEQAESPEWVTTCASLCLWQKLETICPSLDGPKTYLKKSNTEADFSSNYLKCIQFVFSKVFDPYICIYVFILYII